MQAFFARRQHGRAKQQCWGRDLANNLNKHLHQSLHYHYPTTAHIHANRGTNTRTNNFSFFEPMCDSSLRPEICPFYSELLTCTFDLGLTAFSPVDDLLGVNDEDDLLVELTKPLIFPLVLLCLEHSQPHVQELHLNSPLTLIFLLYRCGWTFPAATSQDESGLN